MGWAHSRGACHAPGRARDGLCSVLHSCHVPCAVHDACPVMCLACCICARGLCTCCNCISLRTGHQHVLHHVFSARRWDTSRICARAVWILLHAAGHLLAFLRAALVHSHHVPVSPLQRHDCTVHVTCTAPRTGHHQHAATACCLDIACRVDSGAGSTWHAAAVSCSIPWPASPQAGGSAACTWHHLSRVRIHVDCVCVLCGALRVAWLCAAPLPLLICAR